jgi:hypothetical protein
VRVLVIENGMTRTAIVRKRLPSLGILADDTPYPHAGYRCCAACTIGHPSHLLSELAAR